VVEDVREHLERAGKLKDTINKTEVINDKKIERKQAKTLTEAVQNEPGIDAATGCSICGMKRIQINGLRGEYTTVLVDDVPMHSTVSSYYGMDALTTAGIARVEIARGAGASLLAPGAMGGVINIVTQKATENGLFLDVAAGSQTYRTLSLVGNSVGNGGKRRTTVSAQHNTQGQWDADGNGVNESPRLGNYTLGLRVSNDFGAHDNGDLRLGFQRSDVFGGPISDGVFQSVLTPGAASFEGNDVRRKYTGAPKDVLEAVTSQRLEGTGRWTRRFGESANATFTASAVKQTQDSFYEGDDYSNNDETLYGDLRVNTNLDESFLLTSGLDARQEKMRSSSYAYYIATPREKDDFDFLSLGGYLQGSWNPSPSFETAAAVRLDKLIVNWRGQVATGNEVDQFVLVPRLHLRWHMNPLWVSRLSIGQGYRAPLTFFESEHGILTDGYDILVQKIERSTSAVYSLSFDNDRTTATASLAWTGIQDLAYVDNHTGGRPALKTDTGKHDVFTLDGVFGFQLTKELTLGASYEHFFYNPAYKALLPFAAVEDRARLLLDVESGSFDFNLTATWIGGRNLLPYRYEDRYNIDGDLSSQKLTVAPAFVTMDTKLSYHWDKAIQIYAGVKNLTGYTQAQTENALFYQGGELNVTHLWGPLRGREFYIGLSAKL
jgi:outer membrane receptor for ferrienterochelin and colicin